MCQDGKLSYVSLTTYKCYFSVKMCSYLHQPLPFFSTLKHSLTYVVTFDVVVIRFISGGFFFLLFQCVSGSSGMYHKVILGCH